MLTHSDNLWWVLFVGFSDELDPKIIFKHLLLWIMDLVVEGPDVALLTKLVVKLFLKLPLLLVELGLLNEFLLLFVYLEVFVPHEIIKVAHQPWVVPGVPLLVSQGLFHDIRGLVPSPSILIILFDSVLLLNNNRFAHVVSMVLKLIIEGLQRQRNIGVRFLFSRLWW